ncbi:MAG: DUF2203 family protein [Planctomycetota bacterium]
MNRIYTLPEANRVLCLVMAIAKEFVDRRNQRRTLQRERDQLQQARTPEGVRSGLCELDIRISEQEEAMAVCRREIEDMGMSVLRTNPLTVHIPGQSKSGPVVFCWEEGEGTVCFGHPIGEEEEARRPLRLKAI